MSKNPIEGTFGREIEVEVDAAAKRVMVFIHKTGRRIPFVTLDKDRLDKLIDILKEARKEISE